MKELTIFALLVTVVFCGIIKSDGSLFKVDASGRDWWKRSVIYQIYPRSFKDSDNDGVGDLWGIIEKIDHFLELGVDAIWLSPIYQSPMVDGGYDISDYRSIAKEYGTLNEFKELVRLAHKYGLKIILDLVPNHTSDLHQWFNKSVTRQAGYEDYYFWSNGTVNASGTRSPPNNWISVWSNSGWEWNEVRQQYYFHQFSKQQPDLNFRNEKVQQEIKDVMTYWLDLGVDGFRIDAVPHIYEDALLRDEPPIPNSGLNPSDYGYFDHIYTKDQPETFALVYSWRDFIDNYTKTHGGDERILMTECATSLENVELYYGNGTRLGAHFSFNFDFLGMNENSTATDIYDAVREWYTTLEASYTLNWLTGNHDNHRIASRVGAQHVDAYNMLITILHGVTITYMGEEIGQENGNVTCEEGQDPSAIGNCTTFDSLTRDFERTPFQWDNTVNAGFNSGTKPWLPVSSKFVQTNLAIQKHVENSHYNIYRKSVALKSQLNLYTRIEFALAQNDGVFNVMRISPDSLTYYQLIYNVNLESYTPNLSNFTVLIQGSNVTYQPGSPLVLKRGDSVILQLQG